MVAAVLVFLFVFGPGDTAEQHYIAGVALLEEGQYELAVLEFNEAIELDPNYTDAYYSRGEVYLNSEEYDLAIAGFTKAIELNPNHSYAYHDRGLTYYY